RIRGVTIDAARAVRSVIGVDQSTERGYDNRSAAQDRTLSNDISVRAREISGGVEHVPADVERVGIDAETIIIKDLSVAGELPDSVLLDKKERPDRAPGDHTVARRVRDSDENPVRHVP